MHGMIHRASVRVVRNEGRAWFRQGAVYCKGFAFHPESGQLLKDDSLASYVAGAFERLPERVAGLHGEYAIVLYDKERPGHCAAAVDLIRSIPVFYGSQKDRFYLGDTADFIAKATGGAPNDSLAGLEYLMQGMTTGSGTLVPTVRQLRAGECLVLEGGEVRLYRRSPYAGAVPTGEGSLAQFVDEAIALLEQTFERIVESVGDRPIAIPLSGGLDSRLVAFMLARQGRRDVLCFSYGNRRSFESRTSARVAEQLGFPWAFIDYSPRLWQAWYHTLPYQVYRMDASQLHTIEHEQDWPAVLGLQIAGRIPRDTVVMPGHSGDLLAGSHLPEEVFAADGPFDPVEWIWRKYYRLWPQDALSPDYVAALKDRIREAIPGYHSPATAREAAFMFEMYGWQERQAKMIVNSVRGYESHNLDWRIPLWHGPFAEFWLRVPLALRRDKLLYREVLRRLMGPLYDIPFVARPRYPLVPRWREFFDLDYGRYGMYLGRRPMMTALFRRGSSLLELDEPWAEMLARPLRYQPPQRVHLNGLIALYELMDTRARYEAAR